MSAVTRIDGYQRHRRWVGFPLAVVYKFADDQGSYLAALIAYYGFLSLFPLLLLLVTILGFVLQNDPELQEQLLDSALGQFPVIGSQLRDNVDSLKGNGAGLALGIVLTLYGCLGRRRRDPERVQPGVGGAAQPAAEPDQSPPAQPAAAARPRRRHPRDDRARRADHQRERLRRRPRRPLRALRRDPARRWSPTSACSCSSSACSPPARCATRDLRVGAVAAGVGWQVVQVLGTYFVTHMLRGSQRGLRRLRPRARPDRVDLPAARWSSCSPPRSTSSPTGGCGHARC